jgi:hypothetical protein
MAFKIRFFVIACALYMCAGVISASPTSSGTEFWLCVPGSYYSSYGSGQSPTKQIFITSAVNTTATVYETISLSPITTFTKNVNITAGVATYVDLPWNSDDFDSDIVSPKGIHVTSADPVNVYGYSHSPVITDAYLGLPVKSLGTNHIILSYNNGGVNNPIGTEFAVVGTQDNTTLTINLACTVGTRTKGVPYNVTLNQAQVYLLRDDTNSSDDMSGSTIDSDKPVAVFGAHLCADVPPPYNYCNYLIEQLPPSTDWGKEFIIIPIAARTDDDTYRIIASQDNTNLYLNGTLLNAAPLNKADFFEAQITGAGMITSNNRIMVMQYSNSNTFDNTTGDPFMMVVEPVEQYLTDYIAPTAKTGFSSNYLNISAPDAAVGSVTVDGAAISAAGYTSVAGSGYSVVRVSVALGAHTLSSTLPIGVNVYGLDNQDGYGYPAGCGMKDFVSTPTSTITPTDTDTSTRTPTITKTPAGSPTFTRTATITQSLTPSPDMTATVTPTITQTATATLTLTSSNTATISPTQSVTPDFTLTQTSTVTPSATRTLSLTETPTFTGTMTPTPTSTPTFTSTLTCTPTVTKTATHTITPTFTPTSTFTITCSATITNTPQNTPTFTPVPPSLQLILKGNFENPFRDSTNIVFWLSRDAAVCVKVYTVSAEIVTAQCSIIAHAGYNNFFWDGKNRGGRHIASGTFIYSVTAETGTGEKARAFDKLVCVR